MSHTFVCSYGCSGSGCQHTRVFPSLDIPTNGTLLQHNKETKSEMTDRYQDKKTTLGQNMPKYMHVDLHQKHFHVF